MRIECPQCKYEREVIVHSETKAEDTLDNLGHAHLECKSCGRHFNFWTADKDAVRKVFGKDYSIYK